MKQIYENMVVILLIFISIFVHTTMIVANLQITSARNFHENAIEEIQASHFNDEVVQMEKDEAKKKGWTLKCEYDEELNDMKVTLSYQLIGLPVVGEYLEKEIVAYAR